MRPVSVSRANPVCQICESLFVRRLHSAKPLITIPRTHIGVRQNSDLATSRSSNKRSLAAEAAPIRTATEPKATRPANHPEDAGNPNYAAEKDRTAASQELSSVISMITYLENSKAKIINHGGLPSEAYVSASLQACRVVADYIMDESVRPQIAHMINEMDTTASNLLSLDTAKLPSPKKRGAPGSSVTAAERITAQFRALVDRISDTAYAVVAHPRVFITPSILQQYVEVQARLGKPETLPGVFQLYASKPMPRESSGSINYVNQNPHNTTNAIEPAVIEKALDTAIGIKHLDAAVGIVESSYTTKAFIRAKLLRQAMLPATAVACAPIAVYGLASNLSVLQDSLNPATATNVAFAGMMAYLGFTATLGVIALTTANDQMKRVTWAPGIPLRLRWVREEERAALDKIACAWGFQEKWRQGEEEGPEWNMLREYIASKGMVLDRTELMPGMN